MLVYVFFYVAQVSGVMFCSSAYVSEVFYMQNEICCDFLVEFSRNKPVMCELML